MPESWSSAEAMVARRLQVRRLYFPVRRADADAIVAPSSGGHTTAIGGVYDFCEPTVDLRQPAGTMTMPTLPERSHPESLWRRTRRPLRHR